ncbi:hypothetical protein WJX79_009337 [Trebouxia sp. C0005]
MQGTGRGSRKVNSDVVPLCNALTAVAGVKVEVTRSEEALAILSSTPLFVACCEALLGRKLQGIKRCPASAQERADNVQTVIWELSHTVLQTDLSHISSKGVVTGDPVDIHNLLEILSALLATDDQLITTEVQEQLHGDDSSAVAPVQQEDRSQADNLGHSQEDRSRGGGHSDEHTQVGSGRLSLIDHSMTAKLAHLYALNRDDPKSSQQRQRYEAARHQAEQQRVAVQKQAWLKQSLARRRIEAARQHQQLLLHSRAQAFQSKVDTIRSAQHAAEAAAVEESQRLRRAAAQEALLKETFLEAVEAEKERLLLARDQALQHRPSSSSSALQADKSSQKSASGWMGVLKQHCADLEVGLAQEHQNRVRQEREKALLQQAFRLDAKKRECELHEARLVRVAALDDAALFRSTHSARQHQTLKSQLRHSIQLTAC